MRAVTALASAIGALALVAISRAEPHDNSVAKLPHLGADLSHTSVSRISSGAYMAGQFQIAHSKIVTGAAIIAGGPYGCAESAFADIMPGPGATILNLSKAVNGCMLNSPRAVGRARRRPASAENAKACRCRIASTRSPT